MKYNYEFLDINTVSQHRMSRPIQKRICAIAFLLIVPVHSRLHGNRASFQKIAFIFGKIAFSKDCKNCNQNLIIFHKTVLLE